MTSTRRHASGDLFIVDGLDVVAKDDLASMEHPFYSLTKKPVKEIEPFTYKNTTIEFKPSASGFPTIYDKDLIIYAISVVIAELEEGQDPPKKVSFDPIDFLLFTKKSTGGRSYSALCDSVDRLKGSYFKTNVKINGVIKDSWRSIIGDVELETDEHSKKPKKITIDLSEMLIDSIKRREVLTLNRDYFNLTKPIERRVYQLVRKHIGQQKEWAPYMSTLYAKTGTRARLKEFRRSMREILAEDQLPDFHVSYDADADQLKFTPRESFTRAYSKKKLTAASANKPFIKPGAYQKAKQYCEGHDIYQIYEDWVEYWRKNGEQTFESNEGAFIAWVKKVYASQPA